MSTTGYFRADGRFADEEAATLLVATAVATGTPVGGDTIEIGSAHTLRLTLTASTPVATPSTVVKVQTRKVSTADWRDVTGGGFTAVTGAGTARISVSGLDQFVRVLATTSGAEAALTVAVVGEVVGW